MCELAFLSRASDGLLLVETWDGIPSDAEFRVKKLQAQRILKSINHLSSPGCIEDKNHTFYYLTVDGVCYMTMCANSYPKKLAFSFLEELQRSFVEELKLEYGTHSMDYRSHIETIEKPYYFIKFDRVIQRKKQDYRNPNSAKALQKLNEGLTEVSTIMRKNVAEILERGEKLDEIGRRAGNLKDVSLTFRKVSKSLVLQALLQHYAPIVIITLTVVFIIFWKLYF